MEVGSSKYGLRPGAVYWLDKKRDLLNSALGRRVTHSVYLWYQYDSMRRSKRRRADQSRRYRSYRDRNIFVQYVYKPDVPGCEHEVICIGRNMVWDSIRRMLSLTDHKLLGKSSYKHENDDWKRFYRLIGAVPRQTNIPQNIPQ